MSSDTTELVQSNDAFATDLHRALGATPGNLFFSPFSISSALAMTHAGARGETASEMASTLRLRLPPERIDAAYEALASKLVRGSGDPAVLVANRLWGQTGEGFLEAFLELTRKSYGAALEEVDFAQHPERSREVINRWVEEQTRGSIRDLVPAGRIDRLTRLVLTNAIYFKARWVKPFDPMETRSQPFHVGGRSQKVSMMRLTETLGYGEDDRVQVLQLPYGTHAHAALVILPREEDGVPECEHGLDAGTVQGWRRLLRPCSVKVTLPRFTVSSSWELTPTLAALGMRAAFVQATADFSGLNGKVRDLCIGAVFHRARVEVNEEGTEAAGATAVDMPRCMPPTPERSVTFTADHPFLFLIFHQETGSLLFMGRLADPAA